MIVPVLAAVVMTLVVNTLGGQLIARLNGFTPAQGLSVSVMLQTRGEFALILATLAAASGLDSRIVPFAGLYVLMMAVIGPTLAVNSERIGAALLPPKSLTAVELEVERERSRERDEGIALVEASPGRYRAERMRRRPLARAGAGLPLSTRCRRGSAPGGAAVRQVSDRHRDRSTDHRLFRSGPTMFELARAPKWIVALVVALAVAGGFAALGQWQLERSIESGVVSEAESEIPVPLDTVATTGGPLTTDAVGQLVELDATYVAGDSVILVDRLVESERGCWVVAHAVVSGGATGDGASIAVALGWAADEDAAAAAIAEFEASIPSVASPISGRYLSSESPQQSDFESGKRTALSVAQGINLWADAPDGVYGGYVVLDAAPAGLETIPTPPPNREVSLNLLNVFYAVEWVIFAGFAVFLWWRLVRDEWEKEHGVGDASRPGRSPARANVD